MGSRSSAEEDEMKLIKMPLLSSPRPSTKGGIKALPFIIANEALERLASQGLQPNMVLYLTQEFGLQAAGAATAINLWSAATNFMPLVGAFIADSYTGRFPMIAFGSVVSLLGMIVLWVTTIDIPQAKPACSGSGCTSISPSQGSTSHLLYLLYFSFGLMAIGAGGIRSASVAFGADQIDKRGISTNNIANNSTDNNANNSTDNNANNSTDNNVNNSTDDNANKSTLRKFFIWYYVAYTVSLLLGASFVVYIQEHYGWKVGFGVPVLFMLLSTILFLLASRIYIKYKVNKNLIAGLAQVIVASFRNRSINLPSSGTSEIHYYIEGSSMSRPTENLRCLNKACIIRDSEQNLTPDGKSVDPWSVCTVDQVEELKSLIKVMPIWSTAIFMSVMMSQGSFPVLQAKTMDRHIFKNFEIPAGSITTIFSIVSMGLWVYLYVRVLIPLLSKIKGRPVSLNPKDRMGLGILFSCFSMCVAAIVEMVRRNIAIKEGYSDNPQAVVHMSAMWLVPQSVLMGFAEAFSFIAQIEFFYAELPRSMSSIASCLFTLGMSAGNLVASLIINIVDDVTKRGNRESWVATNINKGHYDYYCWLLACLSFANLLYFAVCQKAYGPCKAERTKNSTVEDGVVSEES